MSGTDQKYTGKQIQSHLNKSLPNDRISISIHDQTLVYGYWSIRDQTHGLQSSLLPTSSNDTEMNRLLSIACLHIKQNTHGCLLQISKRRENGFKMHLMQTACTIFFYKALIRDIQKSFFAPLTRCKFHLGDDSTHMSAFSS